jgi:uncharacterized repeat protein (TIGR03843 family)
MGGEQRREDDVLAVDDVLEVLTHGDLDIEGRLVDASNATLVALATLEGTELRCVYKPVAGERPLWDFPDGTLGHREVAAYTVSAATGWDVVPPTAWREDGPFGAGMCQLWIDTDDDGDGLVDIVPPAAVPDGWRTVLDAYDHAGDPVVLVHADHPALVRMALFDVVINNADRKGGHVLLSPEGAVRGVDHGVTFNLDDKLRTVLWGWAGESVGADDLRALEELRAELDGPLGTALAHHLTRAEIATTARRLDHLVATGGFPLPADGWPSIPWPAF